MVLEDAEINVTYLVEEVYLLRVLERRLDALGIINGTKIKVLNKKHMELWLSLSEGQGLLLAAALPKT